MWSDSRLVKAYLFLNPCKLINRCSGVDLGHDLTGMGCPQAERAVRRLLAAAINYKCYCRCSLCEGDAVRAAAPVRESLL